MSYYEMMCRACPDHSFVEGRGRFVRHAGTGSAVSPAADGCRRDADHDPDPINIDSEQAQRIFLARLTTRLSLIFPAAKRLRLTHTDQHWGYGWVVADLEDALGNSLLTGELHLWEVAEMVDAELNNLNWAVKGGILGDDSSGAVVDL